MIEFAPFLFSIMRTKKLIDKFRTGTITRSQAEALDLLLDQRITEIGMRNNRTDQQRIQEVHDMAAELGARCHEPAGVMKQLGMSEAWHGASAKGKRCYQDLIAKGYSEEKAIAICRSSLKEDAEPTQEAAPTKYQGIDFTPPEAVQKAAMRGLAMRRKHGRGGLTTQQAGKQGIGSGVARATTLAGGKAVSPGVINQMVSFFARHEGNKDTPPDEGNGRIAWLLWGGDAGASWARGVKRRMDAADKKAEAIITHLSEGVAFKSLPVPAKRAYFAKLGSGKAKGKLYKKDPKTGVRKGPAKKKLTRKVKAPPAGVVVAE